MMPWQNIREDNMPRTIPTALIYLGIKGSVLALDRRTGSEVWRTPLKGADFVNVVLDGDALFATARILHPPADNWESTQ